MEEKALMVEGLFQKKDFPKVDRSAAYLARYISKNLVSAGVSSEIQIQLAYAIGLAQPVSINVNTFGKSNFKNLGLRNIKNVTKTLILLRFYSRKI